MPDPATIATFVSALREAFDVDEKAKAANADPSIEQRAREIGQHYAVQNMRLHSDLCDQVTPNAFAEFESRMTNALEEFDERLEAIEQCLEGVQHTLGEFNQFQAQLCEILENLSQPPRVSPSKKRRMRKDD